MTRFHRNTYHLEKLHSLIKKNFSSLFSKILLPGSCATFLLFSLWEGSTASSTSSDYYYIAQKENNWPPATTTKPGNAAQTRISNRKTLVLHWSNEANTTANNCTRRLSSQGLLKDQVLNRDEEVMLDHSLRLPKLKECLKPKKPLQPKPYGFSNLPLKI